MKFNKNIIDLSILKGKRVIIADDHKLFTQSLQGILISKGMKVISICNNGQEAYFHTMELKPDLLLSDINMPKMEGTQLCKKIKNELPNTKIIMVSMYEEKSVINKSFRNGADGYLSKTSDTKEMIYAISKCLNGGTYVNKKIIREKEKIKPDSFSKIFQLTERETDVFKLLIEEKSNSEISDLLCVSKRTVETHKSHIFLKLGVNNIMGMIKLAINHNVLKI